jgi:Cellulose biosynthesis GIL
MAKLGVDGLPQPVENLAEGGVYGLAADQPSIRIPLLARSVAATVANGQRVVIFSSVESTAYFKRSRLVGCDLSSMARLGQIHFVRQRPSSEDSSGLALKRMLSELRHLKLPERSFLLIDLADELMQCLDLVQLGLSVAMINTWAESGKHSVLLCFSLSGLGPKALANLKTCSETFAGFAVIRSAEDDTVLNIRHWFGLKGPAARASFSLTVSEEGDVSANASFTGRLSVDQAQEVYLVTRRAFEDFGLHVSQWKVVDSALDAHEILRQCLGGTVVLHFDHHNEMRELAQTVAAIRALGRAQIRIVIRECQSRLRTAQMVALFRLGVSVIIPQSISGTAGRLMAESLAGSLVTRNFETDVKKALSEARVDFRAGPLAPDEFKNAVELLLNAASEMDLPCTLVVMNPQTAIASNAAMSAIKIALRDAVFAESDDGIWVFLFGCAPESAQIVMTRLLGARFENLLVGWRRLSGARDILPMLSLLAGAHLDDG